MRVVHLVRRERRPTSPLLAAGINLLVVLVGARPVVQVKDGDGDVIGDGDGVMGLPSWGPYRVCG